ncbi:VOC family protein [Bacillus ndiopicus]|uniref:VOC family protein n=1 Tax=Bacillus ndiopicus TaxID=1347368 RepID=UPI0005A6D3BE|nr:VOC family protein [Bacillus ndiopicus]
MQEHWPNEMKIAQIRIARPTNQLSKVVSFYCEGLGLKKIGSFEGHAGYDGVMIGLPGFDYHLEFTQHADGSPCPAPTKDNLLVFYLPDTEAIQKITNRLNAMGYASVPPENPYWNELGTTIEDPDGWRIVLMNSNGI